MRGVWRLESPFKALGVALALAALVVIPVGVSARRSVVEIRGIQFSFNGSAVYTPVAGTIQVQVSSTERGDLDIKATRRARGFGAVTDVILSFPNGIRNLKVDGIKGHRIRVAGIVQSVDKVDLNGADLGGTVEFGGAGIGITSGRNPDEIKIKDGFIYPNGLGSSPALAALQSALENAVADTEAIEVTDEELEGDSSGE
ncbi:MAG: hypothetical protein HUU16_14665 [Candidatus Omnitrophica bacterium]|nr:hypothetical protein [Candidatus Omnitrophota bacterium]